ncbi:MAG TPA: hypothetical protein VGA10_02035 [Thermoanaerobaculia bacterium]
MVVIAAFIGGVFVGIAGDHFYLLHHRPARPQFSTRRIVEHLDRELHFSPQQKSDVQQIIDRHHARIDTLMAGIQPQVRAELDTVNAEIEKILTPQQRVEFKKIQMRFSAAHQRHGFPPPPPRF